MMMRCGGCIEKRKIIRSAETQGECVFVDMAEIWETILRKKLREGFADDVMRRVY